MTIDTIWDGNDFLQVERSEAKRLVKQDKAQLMGGVIDGTELKYRHEFKGYQTSVVRPAASKEEALAKATLMTPALKAPERTYNEWRKIASDRLGKPYNKITKDDVEAVKKDG